MGRNVLAWFADNQNYNLIFAPHARLFKHRRYHGNIDIEDFKGIKNIVIDTGSERSFDMSYTHAADIYLGDVSSQVYEFLYYRRRPCVFLNPNQLEPSLMNFWQFGPVINQINALDKALTLSVTRFEQDYKEHQDYFVNAAFAANENDIPPSQRGAEAIYRFLQS